MGVDVHSELHQILGEEEGRLEYIRRAFQMLPKIEKPDILDIGCGTGTPTIELAKLSNGHVTGIDIDQKSLNEFERKVKELGLSNRIKIINKSLFDMDFPDEHFDIIWAEGSIWVIGFKKGLKEWRRFIKPKGFLVVHEMCWLRPNPPKEIYEHWKKRYPGISTAQENLDKIPSCGYTILEHFPLKEDIWLDLYFRPLAKRIQSLREKYKDDPESLAVLDQEEKEIDIYNKYSEWYSSAYYVMQKE